MRYMPHIGSNLYNWILLISALCCLCILSSCSAFLITAGVLDAPEKHRMFTAQTRKEFEALTGRPIESRISNTGNKVDLYEYVDGEAEVIGTRGGRSMSGAGERVGLAVVTVLTGGLYEIFMIPVAIHERAEATRKIHVIYSSDDNLLAICPNRFSGKQDDLCHSEILSAKFPLK